MDRVAPSLQCTKGVDNIKVSSLTPCHRAAAHPRDGGPAAPQGKGGVLAAKAVGTHGNGGVFAAKAERTQGEGSVLASIG